MCIILICSVLFEANMTPRATRNWFNLKTKTRSVSDNALQGRLAVSCLSIFVEYVGASFPDVLQNSLHPFSKSSFMATPNPFRSIFLFVVVLTFNIPTTSRGIATFFSIKAWQSYSFHFMLLAGWQVMTHE